METPPILAVGTGPADSGTRLRAAPLATIRLHVPEGADRQSRRDRRARHPHAARDGNRRRSPSTPTPTGRRCTCAWPTRRRTSDPAASAESYLRIDRILDAARAARRRSDSPRLRLPQRERRFRRGLRGGRHRLHRSVVRFDPADGLEDGGAAGRDRGGRAGGAGRRSRRHARRSSAASPRSTAIRSC